MAQNSKVQVEIIPLQTGQVKLRFSKGWIIESITLEKDEVIEMKSFLHSLQNKKG